MLASIIGTRDVFQVTSQAVVGVADGAGAVLLRQTKEFIVHPDKIKKLERGEVVVVCKQGFGVRQV